MEISITWNICRVCLVEEDIKPEMAAVVDEPMRHIFNEDEMLAKQIYDCSGIMMKPDDNLPEKICKKCYTLIKYAVKFRETCQASDTYLHNILQRTKSASTLFKKQHPPSLDVLEEFISNDCAITTNNDDNTKETSDKSKRNQTNLEKSSKRLDEMEYSDLIEFANEDFMNESSLKNSPADNIVEYAETYIKEDIATDRHDDESSDSQIILQLNASHKHYRQLNEVVENQDFELVEFKPDSDHPILTTSEKEDEYNVETYDGLEEFIAHKGRHHRIITSDMDSESGDSQAKVSSTVAVIKDGNEIMQFDMEDTKLSSETNDMQTEYIIDEFVIDNNSRDSISLQNSSVLYTRSRKARPVVKNYKTQTTHVLDRKTPLKTENDIQIWVCDICGNNFGNHQLLKAHIKVHRQEKNHECEICLKRFITACNLQAHMRIHTGEKPFECKYCGRRFSDRSSNLRHERTHTNERPFECNQCGKAFSLATTLKKHQKVHTGERSFGCEICDKSFKLPHQLKAHKNSSLHKAAEQLTQREQ